MGNEDEVNPWIEEQEQNFNAGQSISTATIVISLGIGMLVYNGLILPVMGLNAGWLTSILVNLSVGFISYYTASLIITHLGRGKNMKESILSHFDGNYKYMIAYGIINWLSFLPIIFLNFSFICLQIQRMLGYASGWVGPLTALFFIFLIIFIRIKHYAEEAMALGVIGMIVYIVFMIYAWITAPAGTNSVPATGNEIVLAGSLITMLEIHNFLAQNIIKHHDKSAYQSILKKSFLIGVVFYIFASLGSFAIVNRHRYINPPLLVTDYFNKNSVQVFIIQIMYILVTISITPNFLIVSMIRFFQVCKIDLHAHISLKEILYIVIVIGISLGVFMSGINLDTIFSLNGAVLGYLYIIVLPIWVHLKCIYFDKSSGFIEDDEEWNKNIVQNVCQCDNSYSKKWKLYFETGFLILVMVLGMGLLVTTVRGVFKPKLVPYYTHS